MENKGSEFKFAGSFRRGAAATIDMLIANIIRMILFTILGELWMKPKLIHFWAAFKAKFDSNIIGHDPEKIHFLIESPLFKISLIFSFIVFASGSLYYILLDQSKWRATIGKKLMKIIIINNDGARLTFYQSLSHYLLSIVPWFFIFYIFSYQMMHEVNIYKAITENVFNLVFGLITLAWLQIHLITKRKTTAPDLICQTAVIENY